jgi:hypothetical protein
MSDYYVTIMWFYIFQAKNKKKILILCLGKYSMCYTISDRSFKFIL